MTSDSAALLKQTVAKAWALIDSRAFKQASELVAPELARHPDDVELLKLIGLIHLGLTTTFEGAESALQIGRAIRWLRRRHKRRRKLLSLDGVDSSSLGTADA